MKKKYGVALFAGVLGIFHGNAVAADVVTQGMEQALSSLKGETAGPQLNRTLEMMERARVAKQIEEDRLRQKTQIENKDMGTQQQESEKIIVTLKKVEFNKSEVLADKDLQSITNEYIKKDVSVNDLYEMLGKINDLYAKGGYITCKAFLLPQKVNNGVVKILLVEGKTGKVIVKGNKTTKENYIKKRVKLPGGKIVNLNELNQQMMLFNGTNDVQLRIMLQAGEQSGTTDFVLTAFEPQQLNSTLFSDNAGNYTSGMYRLGYFYNIKSISGMRDSLNLGMIGSDGTKAFSAVYSVPISSSGTKITLGFSSNATEIVRGEIKDAGLKIKGHSTAYTVNITQPFIVNDTTRSEFGLEYNHQSSKSSFEGFEYVRDVVRDLNPYFSHTSYGKSHLFYQKHSYSLFGSYSGISSNIDIKPVHYYKFNSYYQKAYRNGQMFSNHIDAQYNQGYALPSSRQFYIGGVNSVRGYRESYLSGERGFSTSFEYQVPISKDRKHNAFIFYDTGHVGGEAAFDDHILHGAGFGVKSSWNKHIYSTVSMGFPLVRTLNEQEVGRTRIHFMISGQF
ncbi:MAG: ShlB/FhaC/HecB family hemolysin secretion/activation protein [Phascolarctobacterium sp.]|nr:ShlB/FhaC/HecB family hemolysin secretion/activation protein [Candidatus Phascolarctobacterium caballi]